MNLSVEEFADYACFTLFNQLPAALAEQTARFAALDAANGWEITLTPPSQDAFFPGGVQVVNDYPTVEVAVPDYTLANFAIDGHDADVQGTLIVRAYEEDADFNTLYRKMNRLAAAIIEVLTRPGALGDGVVVSTRTALRFNPETETQDNVRSGVLLAFTFQTTLQRA